MTLAFAGLGALLALIFLLFLVRGLYGEIARSHAEAARSLGLECRRSLSGLPRITGTHEGQELRVELFSSSHFRLPDALRVTRGRRVHRQSGLSLSAESLEGILQLLARQETTETSPAERGRLVRLVNGDEP